MLFRLLSSSLQSSSNGKGIIITINKFQQITFQNTCSYIAATNEFCDSLRQREFFQKKKKPWPKLRNLKATKIQTPCYYLTPHSPNA